jgi:acetylornithine/N-succinyldiaminopimelate aminotransferase
MMGLLKDNPKLGHISTFAGHPVIAAAGNATVTEILDQNLLAESVRKEQIIRKYLVHNAIKEIRGKGLMLAVIVETPDIAAQIIHQCLKNGLILFFLLFEGRAMRVSPPLNISDEDIEKGCNIILKSINEVIKQ